MTDLPDPHDRFFKELFPQPETVTDFVQRYLPERFVAWLDLRQLEIAKESFIDEELRQYFSDVVRRTIPAARAPPCGGECTGRLL